VFQRYNLLPALTALDNVIAGADQPPASTARICGSPTSRPATWTRGAPPESSTCRRGPSAESASSAENRPKAACGKYIIASIPVMLPMRNTLITPSELMEWFRCRLLVTRTERWKKGIN
jgi:hypothetical protein